VTAASLGILPHDFAAADFSPDELAVIHEGAQRREDAQYYLALWQAWQIGAFVRSALRSKTYPEWATVDRDWREAQRRAAEPASKALKPWQILKARISAMGGKTKD
jgi:hypothetical protein